MPQQAITQEALALPLLRFVAERGGVVNRRDDDIFWTLAWELNLSQDEVRRLTSRGRWQWKATVEYCRQKLIEYWGALEPESPTGIWRLTRLGERLVNDPPDFMIRHWDRWCDERGSRLRDHHRRIQKRAHHSRRGSTTRHGHAGPPSRARMKTPR